MKGIKINRHANIKVMEGINDMYQIYSDGRCYSSFQSGTMLKPYALHSKGNKKHVPHFVYNLQIAPNTAKGFYLARLVMFYFGKVTYLHIDDMPPVTYIDQDSSNINIGNLKFTSLAEIQARIIEKNRKDQNSKIKDTPKNIRHISKLVKEGWSGYYIGQLYNVSDMSISRFKRRNKITA